MVCDKIPIFFEKYLVISKKSSTFAKDFGVKRLKLLKLLELFQLSLRYMVAIAQLAEHRIVVPSVVGSSPTSHPKRRSNERLFCV